MSASRWMTLLTLPLLFAPFAFAQGDALQKGREAYAKGDYRPAVALFSEAIRADTKNSQAYFFRGLAYGLNLGETDKAIQDFDAVIRLDPKHALAWNNRSLCHRQKGDMDKAMADAQEALRVDPKLIRGYLNRADLYRLQGDYDKAIADNSEAINLGPKNPEGYNNRAVVLQAKGETKGALADFAEAIRLQPDAQGKSRAFKNRGDLHAQLADFEKAAADFTEAIRLNPTFPSPHAGLALALVSSADAKQRDGKKALEHATKAVELSGGKDWYPLTSLAAAHAELGKFDEAVALQQKALAFREITERQRELMKRRLKSYQDGKPYRAPQ